MSVPSALWVPDRADVIFIDHSPVPQGKVAEIDADHPMLVISSRAFNEATGIVIGFPMTHSGQHSDNPFAEAFQYMNKTQVQVTAYVLCHQPKSFDWRARKAREHFMGSAHHQLLAAALLKFDTIAGIRALP